MGISGLWKFLQKTGYPATVVRVQPGKHPPRGPMCRIDLAGMLYSKIRDAYRNPGYEAANKMVETELLQRGFHKDSTAIYIDGPPPAHKMIARESREKRGSPLHLNTTSRDGKGLENTPYKNLNKSLFYPFRKKGESLARHLENKGWRAINCPSEADIAIGDACRKDDVVITPDSDAFAYANIHTIWRPHDDHYLVYNVPKVLQHLRMSRVGLTTLAVICPNDYTKRILGMETNFRILKSLEKNGKGK